MSPVHRHLEKLMGLTDRSLMKSPMIFVTGPRQVGKTYETQKLSPHYFNWDTPTVKKAFLQDSYFFANPDSWIIFDEIHKRRDWKRLMKGYYDSASRRENFVVTGSGRFNLHQKGGDSLQGRYDLFHLFPVTWDEFCGRVASLESRSFQDWEPTSSDSKREQDFIRFGGFPSPLLSQSERSLNRWCDLYIQRLVEEDVRDFSKVTLLDKVELLARLLPSRIGSPLSQQSLAEDLECSRDSIRIWLRLFEILYLGFQLPPFHRRIERAIKKEQKWYFFQWALADDPGARFENYVAVQLYTALQYWRDYGLGIYELYYLRDQDRREVDFVIAKNGIPLALVEAKASVSCMPASLRYYSERFKIPGFLLYQDGPIRKHSDTLSAMPSSAFFKGLVSGR